MPSHYKIEKVDKKKFIEQLKNKYRLIIYNDITFVEIFSSRLSLLKFYIIIGSAIALLLILGGVLALYTPMKRLLPSSEYKVKEMLYSSFAKVDSIEQIIKSNDENYHRVSLILQGKDSLLVQYKDTILNENQANKNKPFKPLEKVKNREDSILRATVEREDKFNITKGAGNSKAIANLKNLYLHPPIDKGIIVSKFNNKSVKSHLGVDIAAKKNSHIMSVMKGTVINSNWSVETGYSIIIQHENGFISCYMHNSGLLKKVGDVVKMGEVIAILGNTGEKTTGAHLHFELWYRGKSLNPKDYISF